MSETLEERVRNVASENPVMGTFTAFAGDIVELLEQKDAVVNLLKSNPSIRLIAAARYERKLYWADDTHQWEVYSTKDRQIAWLYRGDNLLSALEALAGEPSV